MELKKEIAELTPGSSAVKIMKSKLKKAQNALSQINAKLERLEDQLAQGKQMTLWS